MDENEEGRVLNSECELMIEDVDGCVGFLERTKRSSTGAEQSSYTVLKCTWPVRVVGDNQNPFSLCSFSPFTIQSNTLCSGLEICPTIHHIISLLREFILLHIFETLL